MSLQPLDTSNDIPEAYKLALSESRRWLILAYESRSTLTLRAQGIGLPDLRKQLEDEDEVLFGFLRFRRRGIVLQYTNPDCSRVVKARAQVHLQTILNFFRDNDFLLETSTPKDITLDNIARITNSTSTSTINSSKKSKRLTDIMEESPIAGMDIDDESVPSGSSDGNSMHSSHKGDETAPSVTIQPKNKLLLKPLQPENSLISPPPTPRSPLPPSPLCRTPSPSQTDTNYESSTNYQRDSYSSESNPSARDSSSTINDFPTTPPANIPETPPTPPEKTRLQKALEMRRQKLSGKPVLLIPKIETPQSIKRTQDEMNGKSPTGKHSPVIIPPSPGHKLRILEAKKTALDEQRRHISSLEFSGRDLLSGWVNFQSSTSLLWRRKFIRITASRDLVLSDAEEVSSPSMTGVDKSTWRWKINGDIKGVEIPDRDEEQLPHSLRIAVERGGAVCCIACQTGGDLINLRRVLGYCLNDEAIFSA